jgi:hypothetical protein
LWEESGDYFVELTIQNPFCIASDAVTISVDDYPVIEVSQDQQICEGEEVTLSASGAETYTWDNIGDGASVVVTPEVTTTYVVTGFNDSDCGAVENINVTVLPVPEAIFDPVGNEMTASNGDAWQWFLNGEIIEGATNQTLEVTENGNYSVEVINEFGCSAVSDEVFIMYVGIEEVKSNELTLFPVPVDGNGVLNVAGVNPHELSNLEIINASGKLVWTSSKGVSQIPLQGLSAGAYVFTARYKKEVVKVQFIVE